MFCKHHGKNLNLDRDVMSWSLSKYDGLSVTKKTIKVGDVIEVTVGSSTGGGHVQLGLTDATVDDIKGYIREGNIPVSKSIEVGIYRNVTTCKFERKSNTEVIRTFKEDKKTLEVSAGADLRLCATILFGKVQVTINSDSKSRKFFWDSDLHGTNVTLTGEKRISSLKYENPSSFCSLERPLIEGEPIGYDLAPVDNARWYFLKLYCSHTPPCNTDSNYRLQDDDNMVPLIKIKNPKEQIIIRLLNNEISFFVGKTEMNPLQMTILTNQPIYLYFEIFRMKMKNIQDNDMVYEDIDQYAVLRNESNIYEELKENNNVYQHPKLTLQQKGEKDKSKINVNNILEDLEKQVRESAAAKKGSKSSQKFQIYDYLKKFGEELSTHDSCDALPKRSSSSLDNDLLKNRPPVPLPSFSTHAAASRTNKYEKNVIFMKNEEALIDMIKDLKARVKNLEMTKKCHIVTTVNVE